mmetsp:Transcript_96998/g.313200  ORF Transcript_96998/g.313200 Transcript_96998/m.313200 type:complete len:253 (+) Transcript_96998:315-1073(+)
MAVWPLCVLTVGSAPTSMSLETTCWWPLAAAWCNAVRPRSSCKSIRWRRESCSVKYATASYEPLCAARCNVLWPFLLRCSTSASASTSAETTSRLAAKNTGGWPTLSTAFTFALYMRSSCTSRAWSWCVAVCSGVTSFESCWLTSALRCSSCRASCRCECLAASCSGKAPVSHLRQGSALASSSRSTLEKSSSCTASSMAKQSNVRRSPVSSKESEFGSAPYFSSFASEGFLCSPGSPSIPAARPRACANSA